MVSMNLQVTDKILASLVTVVGGMSKESQKQYRDEIKHLQLFITNANNTFKGNPTEIIDFEYWEVNNESHERK